MDLNDSCLLMNFYYKKYFSYKILNRAGRNFTGKLVSFSKGSKFFSKSFMKTRNYSNFHYSIIVHIFNETNSSAKLALIITKAGFCAIIIKAISHNLGDCIFGLFNKNKFIFKTDLVFGLFKFLKPGLNVYNFGNINRNNIYSKAGGSSSKLLFKEKNIFYVRLTSGWITAVNLSCVGFIGIPEPKNIALIRRKAGFFTRFFGLKPKVRGVAMNPCDHPHGGGEGKKSQKKAPRSPLGKIFKKSTRSKLKPKLFKYVQRSI